MPLLSRGHDEDNGDDPVKVMLLLFLKMPLSLIEESLHTFNMLVGDDADDVDDEGEGEGQRFSQLLLIAVDDTFLWLNDCLIALKNGKTEYIFFFTINGWVSNFLSLFFF